MPVFNADIKVGRAVADPATDKTLPPNGALSWGGIKSPGALAGTTGVSCALIHGDAWDEVIGSLTENFSIDVKTTIHQNESHVVIGNRTKQTVGNHTETVVGQSAMTRVGSHVATNVGARNNLFVAARTETHSSTSQHMQPTSFMKNIAQKTHFEAVTYKTGIIKFDAWVSTIALLATKIDIVGMKLDVSATTNKIGGTKFDMKAFTMKIRAGSARTIATAALIGLLYFGTPFKPNALPRPSPITPFD